MNKRSAVFLAAGLTVALVAGGFALSQGLVGPEPSSAAVSLHHKKAKPIVRTQKRTVTVHRKAKAPAPAPAVVSAPVYSAAPPAMSSTRSSYTSDDSYGDGSDDGYSTGGGGGRGSGDD